MNTYNDRIGAVLALLPRGISAAIGSRMTDVPIEEIRLRTARPLQMITAKDEAIVPGAVFSAQDAHELLEKLCRHSVYSREDELKQGFLTLDGGTRVGVCGRPVIEDGRIIRLTKVTSFNIRITREVMGCAESILPYMTYQGRPVSTLIAAPPAGGKTTLLRDIARCVSDGIGVLPCRTAIADERGELAGCVDGAPSFDVGARTDVMELAPKAEAMRMLIRSMSPEVIVTDELGGEDDAQAAAEAAACGTVVIASVHASSGDELQSRSSLRKLIASGVFKRVLLVKRSGSLLRILPLGS